MKGNREIFADHDAFMAAYGRARLELERYPGVMGVGFGFVNKGGEFKAGVGIQVYVKEKRSAETLSPGEVIPPTFEGYRVDVRAAQVATPNATISLYDIGDHAREPIIRGGIQIEARRKSLPPTAPFYAAGTLGCIVKKRRGGSGDDNVYLLTCQHVLTNDFPGGDANSICRDGDYVYHPTAVVTEDKDSGVLLGEIQFPLVKEEVMSGSGPYLDCGIARVNVGSTCCGSVCGEHRVQYETTIHGLGPDDAAADVKDWIRDVRDVSQDPRIFSVVTVPRSADGQVTTDDSALSQALLAIPPGAERVRKVGRTTGRTVGVVVSVNGFGYTKRSNGDLVLVHDFIEILLDPAFNDGHGPGKNRANSMSFSEHGDSGSIVVDSQYRAIGILFGGPPPGQRAGSNYGVTWASHIVPVLNALDVYIPTKGGTGPGSDGAEAALYSPGDAPDKDEAQTLFASAAIASAMPAREAARADLDGIGDRLRATRAGAQLFGLFRTHQRELVCLVRGCRPVSVVWHRAKGPAFLAQTLNHLRGHVDRMPTEIGGVSRRELLLRMRAALMRHGGYELKRELEAQGDALMALADAASLDDCLEILRRLEASEVDA